MILAIRFWSLGCTKTLFLNMAQCLVAISIAECKGKILKYIMYCFFCSLLLHCLSETVVKYYGRDIISLFLTDNHMILIPCTVPTLNRTRTGSTCTLSFLWSTLHTVILFYYHSYFHRSELGACEEVIDSVIIYQKYLTGCGLSMSESVFNPWDLKQ